MPNCRPADHITVRGTLRDGINSYITGGARPVFHYDARHADSGLSFEEIAGRALAGREIWPGPIDGKEYIVKRGLPIVRKAGLLALA